jgi:hypothetical protein
MEIVDGVCIDLVDAWWIGWRRIYVALRGKLLRLIVEDGSLSCLSCSLLGIACILSSITERQSG